MDGMKPTNSKQRAQSLVEFALSLTFMLILIVGIFDVARALFTYLSMRDAAQEGTLYASIDPANAPAVIQRTCEASDLLANIGCGGAGSNIIITYNLTVPGQACKGVTGGTENGVEVVVDYPHFPLTMPLLGGLVGADNQYSIPIRASVTDSIIRPLCP